MSSATLIAPRPRIPVRLAATLGVLFLTLVTGLYVNWAVAATLMVAGLGVIANPLDLFLTIVLAAAAATFVNNEGGHLTRDLTILTLIVVYGLFCLLIHAATRRWGLPRSALTGTLALLALSTALATARGVLMGNSLRFVGLEFYPIFGLCTAVITGGLRPSRTDLRVALWLFVLVALVHVGMGLHAYIENRMRTGGIYFTIIPGMVALLLINLLLHDTSGRARFPLLVLIGLLLFHQLISFTRGYWLGLIAGILFSCVLYARRGPNERGRWLQVGQLLGPTVLLLAIAVMIFGYWFGWSDMFAMIVKRFASGLTVRNTNEAASNIARLVEYQASARYLASAPWFGHGLGFTLLVPQPMYGITTAQWFVHESFLLIWLKQGLVGLLAFLGVLVTAITLSAGESRRRTGGVAGWCAGAAACTVYMAVVALTNYAFAAVNGNFLLAVMWGVSLSTTRPSRFSMALWSAPQPPTAIR